MVKKILLACMVGSVIAYMLLPNISIDRISANYSKLCWCVKQHHFETGKYPRYEEVVPLFSRFFNNKLKYGKNKIIIEKSWLNKTYIGYKYKGNVVHPEIYIIEDTRIEARDIAKIAYWFILTGYLLMTVYNHVWRANNQKGVLSCDNMPNG